MNTQCLRSNLQYSRMKTVFGGNKDGRNKKVDDLLRRSEMWQTCALCREQNISISLQYVISSTAEIVSAYIGSVSDMLYHILSYYGISHNSANNHLI